MKTNLIMTLILFLMIIFLPLITLTDKSSDKSENTTEQTTVTEAQTTADAKEHSREKERETETVTLTVSATGKVKEMSVEDYIYGAVCAEMPASFHNEALKAQAVASYTYMKWLKENADNPTDISDNPSVHQAYITNEELKKKWGTSYQIYSQKVREAIESVMYEYLTYNGETAMTVFHGLSPGKTVSAGDIWGKDVPYLKSVTAPGDSLSPDITDEIRLSEEEFLKAFETDDKKNFDLIFKSIKKNKDNYVCEISYGKLTLSATDLRSAYGLKSPHFTAEKDENGVNLTVYGKGHGVGMSQYSADYMARQGSTYKEILAHFYKGTELIAK